MSGMAAVTGAVLRRNLRHAFGNPALLVPAIVFPMMFLIAFAGGLSAVGDVPAFDYPPGYTAFQYVFVLLQSAAFGGVFTGFAVAADFENGFARRLMIGAPQRLGLVAGYALAATVRWVLTASILTVVALLAGMEVPANPAELAGVVALALVLNQVAFGWGAGIAMRFQTLQAGPIMQLPVFLILFLAPVYVPIELLTGWVEGVASVNPISAIMTAARGLLAGRPDETLVAFALGGGMLTLSLVWVVRSLRRAERGVSRG